jgi:type IV pilus assembly protein PilY1
MLWFVLIREAKGVDFSTTPLNIMTPVQPNILFSLGLDYSAANTAAYLENFNTAKAYDGYFDPNKCYQYYFDN